jgi:hypothetical protein
MISAKPKTTLQEFPPCSLNCANRSQMSAIWCLDQGTNCRGCFPRAFEAQVFLLACFVRRSRLFVLRGGSVRHLGMAVDISLESSKVSCTFCSYLTGEGVRCRVNLVAATSSLPRSRTAKRTEIPSLKKIAVMRCNHPAEQTCIPLYMIPLQAFNSSQDIHGTATCFLSG